MPSKLTIMDVVGPDGYFHGRYLIADINALSDAIDSEVYNYLESLDDDAFEELVMEAGVALDLDEDPGALFDWYKDQLKKKRVGVLPSYDVEAVLGSMYQKDTSGDINTPDQVMAELDRYGIGEIIPPGR